MDAARGHRSCGQVLVGENTAGVTYDVLVLGLLAGI
jgi:hypothetical protein